MDAPEHDRPAPRVPAGTAGRLTAVCVAHRILPNPGGHPDTTAIDKRPREGRLAVGALGLELDTQVDRKYHGGHEQGLYAYADEEASWWAGQLGRDVPPGLFGENLRTSGIEVSRAVVGERWRLGEGAGALEVEVTSPRTPCRTFAERLGERRWVRRFTAAGLPGAYLRVHRGGTLGAGDLVAVVSRPGHGVTVADLLSGRAEAFLALLEAHEAGDVTLGPRVHGIARRRTARLRRAAPVPVPAPALTRPNRQG